MDLLSFCGYQLLVCIIDEMFLTFTQTGLITFTKLDVEQNPAATNIQHEIYNDGFHSTLINVSATISKTLLNMKGYMKINRNANKDDKKYSLQILNTVLDFSKLFNGVTVNPFTKALMSNLYKAIDFEPVFPFPPVSVFFCTQME